MNSRSVLSYLPSPGRLGPAIGLLTVYAVFAVLAPESFTSARNLELIVRQTTIVGIVALGMLPVIISGGIDLSVGSVLALVTVVVAWLLGHGAPPAVALAGGLATGVVCGAANGLLISRVRVLPFISTLGTLLVFRGIAKGLANEQKIDAPLSWLNELLAALKPESWWQLAPAGVWLFAVLAVVLALALRNTRFGLYVFAIGSNENASRLCGVPVQRVKLLIYTLCGALTAIAGVMQFSRLTVGDPTVAAGLELDAIAAVVIGGASLSGGEGSVTGTIVGALLMTVIRSGCTQMGLPNWIQEIITGVIIVLAVVLDRLRHRKEA